MEFGITKYQLVDLMSHKGSDGLERVAEYEGVETIAGYLKTDLQEGISGDSLELEDRRRAFGANYIPPVPPKSFLALAFDAIQDKTLIILIIAALVSMVLGLTVEEEKDVAWIEGAAILVAVFIVVIVTALNDWTKERQFRGLQKKLDTSSKSVIMEGKGEKEGTCSHGRERGGKGRVHIEGRGEGRGGRGGQGVSVSINSDIRSGSKTRVFYPQVLC